MPTPPITKEHVGQMILVRNNPNHSWQLLKLQYINDCDLPFYCHDKNGSASAWKYAKYTKKRSKVKKEKKVKKRKVHDDHVGQYVLVRDCKHEPWISERLVRIAPDCEDPFVTHEIGQSKLCQWRQAKLPNDRGKVTSNHIGSMVWISDYGYTFWRKSELTAVNLDSDYPYHTSQGVYHIASLDRPTGPPPKNRPKEKKLEKAPIRVPGTVESTTSTTNSSMSTDTSPLAFVFLTCIALIIGIAIGGAMREPRIHHLEKQIHTLHLEKEVHTQANPQENLYEAEIE